MLAHNVSYQKIIYGGLNVLNSPLSQMHMYVCNKYGPPTTSSMHLINEMSFSSTKKFHPKLKKKKIIMWFNSSKIKLSPSWGIGGIKFCLLEP